MIRVLLTTIAGVLMLSGCGESPRVERKPLVEAVQEPQPVMPADTFHGRVTRETPQADLSSHAVRLDKLLLQAPKVGSAKRPRSISFSPSSLCLGRKEIRPTAA